MIRILIAEDQQILREGLAVLLGAISDFDIVGTAGDGVAALAAVRRLRPDVLLADVRMPAMDGLTLLAHLDEEGILPPTIMLTTFDDDTALVAGLRHGARGYLLKGVPLDALIAAIRTVAAGGSCGYHNDNVRLRRLLRTIPQDAENAACAELSPREYDVLKLMSGGLSNRDIGVALGISEGTVKNHVSLILSKLGVTDRTKAVLKAVREGIV